jgi:hypothetical protein
MGANTYVIDQYLTFTLRNCSDKAKRRSLAEESHLYSIDATRYKDEQ